MGIIITIIAVNLIFLGILIYGGSEKNIESRTEREIQILKNKD